MIEYEFAQAAVPLGEVPTEINAQRELGGVELRETLLNEIVYLIRYHPDNAPVLQVLDGGNCGHWLLPPCLRHEGDVVPDTLVAVRTAEVKDLHSL